MTTRIAGGKRSALLFFQRLVLLQEARSIVSRLTKLQETALTDGLPFAYIVKIDTIRQKAIGRAARRNNDASHHNSSKATIARGGTHHK